VIEYLRCRWKSLIILFIMSCCFISSKIYAYTVPFNNIQLNQNAVLSAGYAFGGYSIIFCYTPNLATTGIITWPYKGITHSGNLPMSLTNNSNATGQLADAQGAISIRNTLSSPIFVSCDFAF
jgi:hypothetical protein